MKKAKIKIIGKSKDVMVMIRSTKSDKLGKYILSNISKGKYKLIVRKIGYKVYRVKIKIDFPITRDILLEKKSGGL